jgi:hypothetical protein
MERMSQNDTQQQATTAPFSPKKKLHVKDKCSLADTVTSARESLKNARDISARNLMTTACSARNLMSHQHHHPTTSSTSSMEGLDLVNDNDDTESTIEEVIAIEDENTDFVSEKDDWISDEDDDEEFIEEIIEYYEEEEEVIHDNDSYGSEDSELEPLPPPIVIPDSLRVKDSDDESSSNNGDSKDIDEDDSDVSFEHPKSTTPARIQENKQPPPISNVKTVSERDPSQETVVVHSNVTESKKQSEDDHDDSDDSIEQQINAPMKHIVNKQPPHISVTKASSDRGPMKEKPENLRPTTVRGFSVCTPKSTKSTQEQPTNLQEFARPATMRGHSILPTDLTKSKEVQPTNPKMVIAAVASSSSSKGDDNKLRPASIRGFSYMHEDQQQPNTSGPASIRTVSSLQEEDAVDRASVSPRTPTSKAIAAKSSCGISFPKTPPPAPQPSMTAARDEEHRSDVEWEKPDWTKNKNLRSTGKSPSGNLAKPITNLPHIVHHNATPGSAPVPTAVTTPTTTLKSFQHPPKSPKSSGKTIPTTPKSPKASGKTIPMAPKSAPQPPRTKYSITTPPPVNASSSSTTSDDSGDSTLPKIEWEKPEWAKKKVLRATSKTETVFSGGKIERPIGGIRPVDDKFNNKH